MGIVGLRPLELREPFKTQRPELASAYEVKKLIVAPSGRGRGVGEALLRHVMKEARRRFGASGGRLVLDTIARLEAAGRLYERCGWATFAPYNAIDQENSMDVSQEQPMFYVYVFPQSEPCGK